MLAYVLALVIGLGSFALYMAAFFFPEVHRKEDFAWSAVGLFYALVLWICAGRITGGVLLGQLASVALLGWFGWQTLTLRRLLVPQEQQTAIPSQDELKGKLEKVLPAGSLGGLQERVTGLFSKGKPPAQTAPTTVERPASETRLEKTVESELNEAAATVATPEEVAAPIAIPEEVTAPVATPEETIAEPVPPNPPSPELIEAAQKSDAEESGQAGAIPVEEIAPDAELAPPAEPTGLGDPEDRKTEPSA